MRRHVEKAVTGVPDGHPPGAPGHPDDRDALTHQPIVKKIGSPLGYSPFYGRAYEDLDRWETWYEMYRLEERHARETSTALEYALRHPASTEGDS